MAIRNPDGAKNSHILPTGQWYAPSGLAVRPMLAAELL